MGKPTGLAIMWLARSILDWVEMLDRWLSTEPLPQPFFWVSVRLFWFGRWADRRGNLLICFAFRFHDFRDYLKQEGA